MSKILGKTIVSWILLFTMISYFHSYTEYLAINNIPGFQMTFPDVLAVGIILTFVSLASTFLLFIYLIRLIRKTDQITPNLILINIILFISILIAVYITSILAASWWEGLYYVGFYAITFTVIINIYFSNEKRKTNFEL